MGTLEHHLFSINKVIDYIEKNIYKEIILDELAIEANISKFHFLRVFKQKMGETPIQLISRLRLEKVSAMLVAKPNDSISDVAYECGFTDLSSFSKSFKKKFGKSASIWRKEKISNFRQIDSKIDKLINSTRLYFCNEFKTLKWRTNMMKNKSIEVKKIDEFAVAYYRYVGPYSASVEVFENSWNKIINWGISNDIMQQKNLKSLIMYHDDPSVTAPEKQRISFCLSVEKDQQTSGEIGKMKIQGGRYVVASFELGEKSDFQEAWQFVMHWVPQSGLKPAMHPPFELYPKQPKDGIFYVDIYIPVV